MATSFQTPRQRGLPTPRPSYGASPNFSASTSMSASTSRYTNQRPVNGHTSDPKTPARSTDGGDLDVGDEVNVPGDMYGTVRFIGSVAGKNGTFVGVELNAAFASRGKNDGDVDGVQYFTTSIPTSGIFLPIHRAAKRTSPTLSLDGFPGTPDTPTYSTVNGTRTASKGTTLQTKNATPPTPALPSKFAQTVGPGARPPSPNFKPKRPSLPRPESPFRKPAPNLAPTPARNLSQSQFGNTSRTPAKSSTNFKASTTTRPSLPSQTARPYSRSSSRAGNGILTDDERAFPAPASTTTTTNGAGRHAVSNSGSFAQPVRSPSRLGSAGSSAAEQEVQRLKRELSERDRRLDEQAASLTEMEQSVKELSGLLPGGGSGGAGMDGEEQSSVAQLRQILREKNEKISLLTAEFDAHRADFRSTLDSLEMASTETERVYEEQKRDLLAQLAELQEVRQSKEDLEGVARQLKQLEELVAELEEGLEESRRGEAEARGEVEFLRGEVERGRSELKREREKAAATAKRGSGGSAGDRSSVMLKEMEKKDDEIRGLKAIIHGLSSTGDGESSAAPDGTGDEEFKKLQQQLEDSRKEKEELEEEVEQLRRETATMNGNASAGHVRNESELTATGPQRTTSGRTRGDTIKPANAVLSVDPAPTKPTTAPSIPDTDTTTDTQSTYCEMCGASDHDTLECSEFRSTEQPEEKPVVYSPGKENEHSTTTVKNEKVADEDKWCALCEKDGHLAYDCPEEQY